MRQAVQRVRQRDPLPPAAGKGIHSFNLHAVRGKFLYRAATRRYSVLVGNDNVFYFVDLVELGIKGMVIPIPFG